MTIRRKSEDITINLTPMIDVVFLLVIFFMVGSKYSESESRVNVNVASGSDLQAMTRLPDKRTVDVSANGAIQLDGQPITLDQLVSTIQNQQRVYPALKVRVRAEDKTEFNTVNTVLRAIHRSGVSDFDLAGKTPSRGGFR